MMQIPSSTVLQGCPVGLKRLVGDDFRIIQPVNYAQLALGDPECVEGITPTQFHHSQPEPLIRGGMGPSFHLVSAKL